MVPRRVLRPSFQLCYRSSLRPEVEFEQLLVQASGEHLFEIAHEEFLLIPLQQSERLAFVMIDLAAFLHNIHMENIKYTQSVVVQFKLSAYISDILSIHRLNIS